MTDTEEYYRKNVEDYKEYADYRRDQDRFEEQLKSRKRVLFNALSDHEHDKAAELLGIAPEITSSLRASFATAAWSLDDEIGELIDLIDSTAVIDDSVKMHWMSELERIPELENDTAGHRLATFGSVLIAWKTRFKAERRMLDLGLASEMSLERDISSIARKTLSILENLNR